MLQASKQVSEVSMSHSSAPERASGAVITEWRPEDPAFWQQRGQRIASRNLWISVPCLLLAFCVWMLFSAVAVNLPKVGFDFTTEQLFMLTALPSVSGALLRVPYSFMVPLFGGRRWTAFSTGILIIPCVWLGFAVQDTSTPFSTFIIISLLCGFGANFASSMANISFFFPKQKQGGALGLNGGLGNMGVSVMQLVAPLVVSLSIFAAFGSHGVEQPDGTQLYLANAAWIWVPFLAIFTLAAWFGMNELATSKASLKEQLPVLKRGHLWIMSLLYLATFGSFIGFSAGFAMLSKTQFLRCRSCITPSLDRSLVRWRVLRAAQSLTVWADPRHAGELHSDGYFQCLTVPDAAIKRCRRQLHCLLRGVPGVVPDGRTGEWFNLPDDLRNLSQTDDGQSES
jgi:NNP family nitrate/nitrite transporter-like MFS transporter